MELFFFSSRLLLRVIGLRTRQRRPRVRSTRGAARVGSRTAGSGHNFTKFRRVGSDRVRSKFYKFILSAGNACAYRPSDLNLSVLTRRCSVCQFTLFRCSSRAHVTFRRLYLTTWKILILYF